MATDQQLLNSYNQTYTALKPKWLDALDLYEVAQPNGLARFLIRSSKEDNEEYAFRMRRVLQINISKIAIELYVAMLFSVVIRITSSDKYNDEVQAFLADCNGRGDSLTDYFREQVVPLSLIYGSVDVFTDMSQDSNEVISLADQQAAGNRPYCYIIPPVNRVRWHTDDKGKDYVFYQSLDIIEEQDAGELGISHNEQYQCWWTDRVATYSKKSGALIGPVQPNPYGFVPAVAVIPFQSARFYKDKIGVGLCDDLLSIQKNIINTLSLIDDFHYRLNFALLTIVQDEQNGGQPLGEGEVNEAGNNRLLQLIGANSKAAFVSPDPSGTRAMAEHLEYLFDKGLQTVAIPTSSDQNKTHQSGETIRRNASSLTSRLTLIARHLSKSKKQIIENMLRVTHANDPDFDVADAQINVEWSTGFSDQALINELEKLTLLKAVIADVSPTAFTEYAKKVLDPVLYDIPPDRLKEIEAQLTNYLGPQLIAPVQVDPLSLPESGVRDAAKVANTETS